MIWTIGQVAGLFTAPALAAAGAAAVSIPIAIHMLTRLQRQPQTWGAMRFLLAAFRKHRRRLQLEQMLLLLVRCLVVLCLGLALSGPVVMGLAGLISSGLDPSGRQVHLVIDDALSSRATSTTEAASRFEDQRRIALQLLDDLPASDRIMLWRASRPATAMVGEPTIDRNLLRQQLEDMQPRFSRRELPVALEQIAQRMQEDATPQRTAVVLLSGFARDAGDMDQQPSTELRALGEQAQILATRPAAGLDNVQITRFAPRRHLVLPAETGTVVAGELTVTRFGSTVDALDLPVNVQLLDAEGRLLEQNDRRINLASGQASASINVDMPIDVRRIAQPDENAKVLLLQAQLQPPGHDSLIADNRMRTTVQWRRQLFVGMVGDALDVQRGLTPQRWLELALTPDDGMERQTMHLRAMTSQMLQPENLETLDALMILRPDTLNEAQWQEAARFAGEGGLVWVFVPSEAATSTWMQPMRLAFDLDWQLAMEAQTYQPEEGLPLMLTTSVPGPLQLLGSDWEALLRPIRVHRWLPLRTDEDDAWLRLVSPAELDDVRGAQMNDAIDAAQNNDVMENQATVLLAHRPIQRGHVLLSTVALDTQWSNLPTKPLFVPLLHETLRGLMGAREDVEAGGALAGDQPLLFDDNWRGAARMQRMMFDVQTENGTNTARQGEIVGLQTTERGVRVTEQLHQPGFYMAVGESPAVMAVNADSEAGNTRGIGELELSAWLDGMAGDAWAFLEPTNPAQMLQARITGTNIGWMLLWLTLILLLLETMLARSFSHAKVDTRQTLGGRMFQSLAQLRGRKAA